MKICKFGGTSLASLNAIKNVKNILENNNYNFVVVSAPGKRFSDDVKVTDLLIELTKNKNNNNILNNIKKRFSELVKNLKVDFDCEDYFKKFKSDIINNYVNDDYIISRGEYLNAFILSKFFNLEFLDAKQIIKFDDNGNINLELIKNLINKLDLNNFNYIVPGFYGENSIGNCKIFSRGGSDITGAILASILNAQIYDNYTDVDGIYTVDPKIVKSAKIIESISYSQLRSLTYLGAEVLNTNSLLFVDNKLPIRILNTFNSNSKGTLIFHKNDDKFGICAITCKKTIYCYREEKSDFFNKIKIIDKNKFYYFKTEIDDIIIYLDQNYSEFTNLYKKDISIVSIIFYDKITKNVLINLLKKLQNIKIYDMFYINENIISFVVDKINYEATIKNLYKQLFA